MDPILEQRLDQINGRFDHLLNLALDLQTDIKSLDKRLARLEAAHEKVYSKLDGFIVIRQRQAAELAALRMSYFRPEEHQERLEKARV